MVGAEPVEWPNGDSREATLSGASVSPIKSKSKEFERIETILGID